MALRSVSELKAWFVTLAKPTQSQFWDWLDSFVHKTDAIAQDKVAGLPAALANIPVTYTMQIDGADAFELAQDLKLESIYIKADEVGNAKIGSTEGGGEYFDDEIGPGNPANVDLGIVFDSALVIHFTGTFTAKIYTR